MARTPQDNMTPKKNRKPGKPKLNRQTSIDEPFHWTKMYGDIFSINEFHIPEEFIKRLALDLVDWADRTSNAIKVDEFLYPLNISKRTYESWRVKYTFLDEADSIAKSILGCRRERNALERTWDVSTCLKMMPHYDQDWKNIEIWRNSLSNEMPQHQQFKPLTAIDLGDGTIIKLGVTSNDETNGNTKI